MIVKHVEGEQEKHCIRVFNRQINEGAFPKIWKDSRLVLLEKSKKEGSTIASYRPICLINYFGRNIDGGIRTGAFTMRSMALEKEEVQQML